MGQTQRFSLYTFVISLLSAQLHTSGAQDVWNLEGLESELGRELIYSDRAHELSMYGPVGLFRQRHYSDESRDEVPFLAYGYTILTDPHKDQNQLIEIPKQRLVSKTAGEDELPALFVMDSIEAKAVREAETKKLSNTIVSLLNYLKKQEASSKADHVAAAKDIVRSKKRVFRPKAKENVNDKLLFPVIAVGGWLLAKIFAAAFGTGVTAGAIAGGIASATSKG